jgi:mycofactocin precursor
MGEYRDEASHGLDAETDETLDGVIEEELLVEDVSIDGMCGVY